MPMNGKKALRRRQMIFITLVMPAEDRGPAKAMSAGLIRRRQKMIRGYGCHSRGRQLARRRAARFTIFPRAKILFNGQHEAE